MYFITNSARIELLVKDNQAIVAITQFKEQVTLSFHAEEFLNLLTNGVAFMETLEGAYIKMIFNHSVGHLRTDKGNKINTYIRDKFMLDKLKNELINLIEVPYIQEGGWMSW